MNKGPGLNKYLIFNRKALLVFCPSNKVQKKRQLRHEIKSLNVHHILNILKAMIEM